MMLRLICFENDFGVAANVGGPANISHKTFELSDSVTIARACDWLNALQDSKEHRFVVRGIKGVELVQEDVDE